MSGAIRDEWRSDDGSVRLILGDCLRVAPLFDVDTFDAIVTDPPAGIEFMGKEWDSFKKGRLEDYSKPPGGEADGSGMGADGFAERMASRPNIGNQRANRRCLACGHYQWSGSPCKCERPQWSKDTSTRDTFVGWLTAVATEMLRVLKPGGHALVWALPRTSHWTATALEDAGFEIRDRVSHLFGSGFPKSLDVSKQLDRMAGVQREVVGRHIQSRNNRNMDTAVNHAMQWEHDLTAPATEAARQWDGWGTALKPACEDWWLVRKPLSEKTVAANVLRWGTGALNIDGCRIGTDSTVRNSNAGTNGEGWGMGKAEHINGSPSGRWPANVCLSHHPECRCVGTKRVKAGTAVEPSGKPMQRSTYSKTGTLGRECTYADADGLEIVESWECHPDCPCAMFPEQVSGGTPASRKADKFRNSYGRFDGCEVENGIGSSAGSAARFFYCAKASRADRGEDNKHPTVKNTDLMRWLCRLITPPDGLILDCFLGSGSTAVAAYNENFRIVGIEQDADYFGIAVRRVRAELKRFPLFEPPKPRQTELFEDSA